MTDWWAGGAAPAQPPWLAFSFWQNTVIVGPSHEQGGIKTPLRLESEREGGTHTPQHCLSGTNEPFYTSHSTWLRLAPPRKPSKCCSADKELSCGGSVFCLISGVKVDTATPYHNPSYATHTSNDFEKIWKRLLKDDRLARHHIWRQVLEFLVTV